MICLLLIMTVIFVNGTEGAEQKVRHSDTVLREEEMSAKTKAWLLMVESGKVDEEELRRITPKSIFIAPLLTSRTGKCKEGYRHDHLGQCVKVIKIDPKVQLELLLKRLNSLYAEKKQEEEALPQVSNGPLHFSIPISNAEEKINKTNNDTKPETKFTADTTANASASQVQGTPEFMPVPLPVVMLNVTNQTKEIESSGSGPLNDSEAYEASHLEGSGVASGDEPAEEETTSSVTILPEEADYLDVTEASTTTTTTTEIQTTTEIPPETSTATEPSNTEEIDTTDFTESYQSITDSPGVIDSVTDLQKEKETHVQKPQLVTNKADSDIIHFPGEEVRARPSPPPDSGRIRFPDEVPQSQQPSYQSLPPLPELNSQFRSHAVPIPREQFWWLPENWKVDENQQKSALVKFWSRLPLIHDVSYSGESPDGFKNSFVPSQPHPPSSQTKTQDFPIYFKQKPPLGAPGKSFRGNRFQDFLLTPRQNFRIHR